jgi:hypothetical protein
LQGLISNAHKVPQGNFEVIDFLCIPCPVRGTGAACAEAPDRLPAAANSPLILRHFLLSVDGFYLDLTGQNKDDIALAFCRVPERQRLHAALTSGVAQPLLAEHAERSAHYQQFRIIEGTWFGSLEQQGAS